MNLMVLSSTYCFDSLCLLMMMHEKESSVTEANQRNLHTTLFLSFICMKVRSWFLLFPKEVNKSKDHYPSPGPVVANNESIPVKTSFFFSFFLLFFLFFPNDASLRDDNDTTTTGRGCAAMVIESLSLYYHINCFRCSVCHIQLGKNCLVPCLKTLELKKNDP